MIFAGIVFVYSLTTIIGYASLLISENQAICTWPRCAILGTCWCPHIYRSLAHIEDDS